MAWTAPRDWTAISGGIVTAASLNTDVRDNLGVLSTHTHTGAAGFGASTLSGLTLAALVNLTFADQSANPDAAGELQRNGNDLLFYGSSAVNLTAANAAAGTASLRSLNTTSTTAAAGNHGHTMGDLTPAINGVVGTSTSGSTAIEYGVVLAHSSSSYLETGVTPSVDVALVASCNFILAGQSGTSSYSVTLTIDGTAQGSAQTGNISAGAAVPVNIQGMKAVSANGAKLVRAAITNTSGSEALLWIATVNVHGVAVS